MSEAHNSNSERIIGRPFEKGRSGNPGGRPKSIAEITELARSASPAAMRKIISILDREDASIGDVLKAAQEILNRAYGKPKEIVEATVKHSLEELVMQSYRAAEQQQLIALEPSRLQ